MKKMLMSAWLRAFNQDSRGQMKCGGTIEWHSATSESGYLQPEKPIRRHLSLPVSHMAGQIQCTSEIKFPRDNAID